MEPEITPEPTAAERAAIERALSAAIETEFDGPSAWWWQGIRENVLDAADDPIEP